MENKYYVYEHLTMDGEVFYVGKGHGDRAHKIDGRSDFWKKVANKYGREVRIVQASMTEEAAYALEIKLIAQYGRRDLGTGNLVNLTDGGEGRTGAIGDRLKGKWSKILADEGLGVLWISQDNTEARFQRSIDSDSMVSEMTEDDVYGNESTDDGNLWDALAVAHTATPLEARLQDRRRGTICGLDERQLPVSLKLKRKHRELPRDWRKRIQHHIINTYS